MAKHISTLEMTDAEWKGRRHETIGSSEIGAICGISTYDTPRDIYNQKKGLVPPFDGNKHTRWGLLFEPSIAQAFIEDELSNYPGCRVVQDHKIRMHSDFPWATCNLDRLIIGTGEPIILELKSTTSFAMKAWGQVVPAPYYAQVQWQMFVSGYRKAVIWVAVMDTKEFVPLKVDYSEEYANAMLEEAVKLMNALSTGDPSGLSMLLKDYERYTPVSGSKIEADDAILDRVTKLVDVKSKKADLEKTEKMLSNEIKLYMGENEALVQGDRVIVLYSTVKKESYVVPALTYRQLKPQREKKVKEKKA